MRLVLVVGWFHIIAYVLGAIGALDYYVCIKANGLCKPQVIVKDQDVPRP